MQKIYENKGIKVINQLLKNVFKEGELQVCKFYFKKKACYNVKYGMEEENKSRIFGIYVKCYRIFQN